MNNLFHIELCREQTGEPLGCSVFHDFVTTASALNVVADALYDAGDNPVNAIAEAVEMTLKAIRRDQENPPTVNVPFVVVFEGPWRDDGWTMCAVRTLLEVKDGWGHTVPKHRWELYRSIEEYDLVNQDRFRGTWDE